MDNRTLSCKPRKVYAMANLMDIQSQIEKLQRQAEDIKKKDFEKTVQEMRAKIGAFGITEKDLFPAKGKGSRGSSQKARSTAANGVGKPSRRSASAGKKIEPKYRGPQGETWSGRGLAPKWLAALEAEGKRREDFAIRP